MSGIREAEDALFDEWESLFPDGGYFNRDGVVDPGQWESKRGLQLLFLMKDTDGLREDLRDFLCRGGRGQTWNTVVRWAGALSDESTAVPERSGAGDWRAFGFRSKRIDKRGILGYNALYIWRGRGRVSAPALCRETLFC